MSLKAKIEAVIYAAEEPVTVQQLVTLLGGEAQAELDHLAAAQHILPLHASVDTGTIPLPSEPELLNEEVFDIQDLLDEAEEEDRLEEEGSARTGEPAPAEDTPPEIADPAAEPGPAAESESGSEPTEASAAAPPSEPPLAPQPPSLQPEPTPGPKDDKQLARDARERERAVRDYFRRLLDELIRDYSLGDRGLEIREVANGFRLATKPEYHDAVRGFAKSLKPPLKLTLQALETLAVVAYKQPVTAPEVSEIRGVDSGGVLGSLMARKLVSPAGRKQVVGRPILYRTTKDFLLRFGLKDIGELPGIEEFERMAGELAETDAIQEEIPMSDSSRPSEDDAITAANLREEEEASEPQADGDSTPLDDLPVDGRLSGISHASQPTDSVDTSAEEAAIQSDEAASDAAATEAREKGNA